MEESIKIDYLNINKIKPYKRNAKKHPQEQIEQIINSIKAFGMNDPIGVWGEDNVIVEGHGRYLALREMGESGEVPVIHLDNLTDEQRKAYALAHNKLTMNTGFDDDILSLEMEELDNFFDMSDFGFDTDDDEIEATAEEEDRTGNMAEKYLIPPFSVIYANKPDWLARKRAWVAKGLRSEIGRGGGDLLTIQGAIQRQTSYTKPEGGTSKSVQEQHPIKQLHEKGQHSQQTQLHA